MTQKLTYEQRRQIAAIVSLGGTQHLAAQCIGCHPNTITNIAKQDPHFAAELGKSALVAEFRALQTLAHASSSTPHVAKWMLERLYPDRYRPRQPHCFSIETMKQLLLELIERLAAAAQSEQERQRWLSTITQFAMEVCQTNQPFLREALSLEAELMPRCESAEPPTDTPASEAAPSETMEPTTAPTPQPETPCQEEANDDHAD